MKVYFTISGFRAICDYCKVNGHVLIAIGEIPQPADKDAVCDCACHARLSDKAWEQVTETLLKKGKAE